jgi:double zinc ribbon protein
MINPSTTLKRRAAVGVILALLSFMGCLAGVLMANRMEEAALRPEVNLQPIVQRLQQFSASYFPNSPFRFYPQALQETVSGRSDIVAAAVVSDYGTILATYPEDQSLVGQTVTPPPPGKHYPVPGITADQPTPDGWYLYLRPGDAANDGPIDPTSGPAGHRPMSLDDPLVETRFRLLIARIPAVGSELPAGHLITTTLPDHLLGGADALLVLPYPHRAAYELATYYLRPAFIIGALVSLVLYCLMLPWWTYLDARPRTEKAAPLAVFVLLTNFLGWLTYLVIRPEADRLCPVCVSLMDPGYRCCPHCGWSSKARCRQCGRPARSDWRFCPYCEAPCPSIELEESRLTTASGGPGSHRERDVGRPAS